MGVATGMPDGTVAPPVAEHVAFGVVTVKGSDSGPLCARTRNANVPSPGQGTTAQKLFGMGFIQLGAGHVHLAPHLAMVGLSALGSHPLEAMHRFEIHRTNVGGPFVTDAPPLTFHQPYDRVFWALAAGHQGALPVTERRHAIQRSRSMCLCAPVHDRCAMVPSPG